jgi:hypothetical protein
MCVVDSSPSHERRTDSARSSQLIFFRWRQIEPNRTSVNQSVGVWKQIRYTLQKTATTGSARLLSPYAPFLRRTKSCFFRRQNLP